MKPSLDDTVNLKTAFIIMQRFLEAYWKRVGKPDELGDVLSFISLLQDGSTADPAMMQDWLVTAEAVIGGKLGPLKLELKKE
jgi:hypothetical protein